MMTNMQPRRIINTGRGIAPASKRYKSIPKNNQVAQIDTATYKILRQASDLQRYERVENKNKVL